MAHALRRIIGIIRSRFSPVDKGFMFYPVVQEVPKRKETAEG